MEKMLNCNSKTLEKLFIDSHEWNTVIKDLNHVRVEEKREELELKDFADPRSVWPIIEEAGINVHYETSVLKQLLSGGKKASAYPRDLFVAKLDEGSAKKIAARNGVLVVSADNPSLDQIKRSALPVPLIKGEKKSWHDCFMQLKKYPSIPINSIVLIDRYLFTRNGHYGWKEGVQNIKHLLSEALPPTLDERFDLLFITSDDSWDRRAGSLDRIIIYLKDTIKKLRYYKINIEVLVLGKNADSCMWEEAHDRRLISNYYRVAPTWSFFAFVGPLSNEVYRSQTINIDCAYSNIDNEFAQLLGFPIKGYDATLSEIHRFVQSPGRGPDVYFFYKNGYLQKDLSSFENRIVLLQK